MAGIFLRDGDRLPVDMRFLQVFGFPLVAKPARNGATRIFTASLFTDGPPVAMSNVVHFKDAGAGLG